MRRIIVLVLYILTSIFGLELNEAATLLNQIQREVNTTYSTEYTGKGLAQNLDVLIKLSRDLDVTESEIKIRLKSLEKLKNDLILVQMFKQGVNGLLGTLIPGNSTLARRPNQHNSEINKVSSKKKKYFISNNTDQVPWLSAIEACINQGKQIATVESEEEQNELEKTMRSLDDQSNGVWIGASDIVTGGQFVWSSSGRPLSYTNWRNGQPSGRNEHCLLIDKRLHPLYTWFNVNCGREHRYACEYWGG